MEAAINAGGAESINPSARINTFLIRMIVLATAAELKQKTTKQKQTIQPRRIKK